MARPQNESQSVRIEITASQEVAVYLDKLARLGVHGKNRSEVARFLVSQAIERLIHEHFLELPK